MAWRKVRGQFKELKEVQDDCKVKGEGYYVAQPFKCVALDFGSYHDLRDIGSSLTSGCALSMESV